MKFNINNTEWEIKELQEHELELKDVLGETVYTKQEIHILKDAKNKKRTLKHELMNVWLWEYGHSQIEKEFTNEDVCEIVACSNDFINEVVEQYMNKDKYNKNDDALDAYIYAMQKKLEDKNKENILPC